MPIFLVAGLLLSGSLVAGESAAQTLLDATGIRSGLIVHLGCGNGELTAELGRNGAWLVHGLAANSETAATARTHIRAAGVYGQVSVEVGAPTKLPYADNLANVVVIDPETKWPEKGLPLVEALRVVCPKGVVLLGGAGANVEDLKTNLRAAGFGEAEVTVVGGSWVRIVKPRPAGMDEWTHEFYRADGNAVSHDTELRPPSGLRWLGGTPNLPSAARQFKGSTKAVLAADGRFLQLVAPAPGNGAGAALIARDAFNGLRLWQRDVPAGKADGISNLMIAQNNKVYLASARNTVMFMNAATGETVFEFKPGTNLLGLACEGERLLVAAQDKVHALNASAGNTLWATDAVRPQDLRVGGEHVVYIENGSGSSDLVGLDLATGKRQWRTPLGWTPSDPANKRLSSSTLRPRFCQQGVVVLEGMVPDSKDSSSEILQAFSAADGKHLWTYRAPFVHTDSHVGFSRYAFVREGLVWVERGKWIRMGAGNMTWEGLDPRTGEVKRSLPHFPSLYQKCQLGVATEQFLIDSRNLTLVDWHSGKTHYFTGSRGGCGIGAIPANGLLYNGGLNACACSPTFLRGPAALAANTYSRPDANGKVDTKGDGLDAFEKGLAYGAIVSSPSKCAPQSEWPTYRHDAGRSGGTVAALPANPEKLWVNSIATMPSNVFAQEWTDHPISAPVVGEGMVVVAASHAHEVVAMDLETGKTRWRFTAGGRIDSPPTIHKGLCLFGSHDGWIYCLRAADGQLAWRRPAAPAERRIQVCGQLESPWPAPGSVLVANETAYCLAGRSSHSDGGLVFLGLDVATGKTIFRHDLNRGDGEDGKSGGKSLSPLADAQGGRFACTADILVSDGSDLCLSTARTPYQFDGKTGQLKQALTEKTENWPVFLRGSRYGFLNRDWLSYSLASRIGEARWNYRGIEAHQLVFHQESVCGIGRQKETDMAMLICGKTLQPGKNYKHKGLTWTLPLESDWKVEVREPMQANSLLLAGPTLVVGGSTDRKGAGQEQGFLWFISATDGRKVGEVQLPAPPRYDGLAAVQGKLIVSTADGTVLCLGQR